MCGFAALPQAVQQCYLITPGTPAPAETAYAQFALGGFSLFTPVAVLAEP